MEIIQVFGYTMIPICIIISILLMIYGKTRHIKYLDPKVPLGRLFYFLGNAFSFMCCILLISFGSYVIQSKDIAEGIKYLILGYSFGIYGFTFFLSKSCNEHVAILFCNVCLGSRTYRKRYSYRC